MIAHGESWLAWKESNFSTFLYRAPESAAQLGVVSDEAGLALSQAGQMSVVCRGVHEQGLSFTATSMLFHDLASSLRVWASEPSSSTELGLQFQDSPCVPVQSPDASSGSSALYTLHAPQQVFFGIRVSASDAVLPFRQCPPNLMPSQCALVALGVRDLPGIADYVAATASCFRQGDTVALPIWMS